MTSFIYTYIIFSCVFMMFFYDVCDVFMMDMMCFMM